MNELLEELAAVLEKHGATIDFNPAVYEHHPHEVDICFADEYIELSASAMMVEITPELLRSKITK